MCFPAAVPLIGLAASGAAAYMGQKNANKQSQAGVKAQGKAVEAERARQRGFEAEGSAVRDKALGAVASPSLPVAALQARREAAMRAAVGQGAEYKSAPGSAPKIVQGEVARKGRQATAAAGDSAARTGRLAAYGDQQFGNNMALTDASRGLRTIGGASRDSASLLPSDVASRTFNATRTGDGPTFADTLGLVGQGMQLYGGMGGGADLFSTMPKPRVGPMGRANPLQVGAG